VFSKRASANCSYLNERLSEGKLHLKTILRGSIMVRNSRVSAGDESL
jgi:hypothetical protein